jgi:flagellar basal body-associated protein FliL
MFVSLQEVHQPNKGCSSMVLLLLAVLLVLAASAVVLVASMLAVAVAGASVDP